MYLCWRIPDYRSFRKLLDSGYIPTIVNVRIIPKIINKYTPVNSTKWITQAGNFTTISMVNVEFSLLVLSTTTFLTWKCHIGASTAGSYDMIIGRDLHTKLGIYLKFSTNTIECGEGPYQWYTTPMVNLDDYDFEIINIKMRPFLEDSFLNTYLDELHKSWPICTEIKRVRTTLNIN